MTEKVELFFKMTCEVSPELADELGKDIAHDLLCEIYNGENVVEWDYVTHKVIM